MKVLFVALFILSAIPAVAQQAQQEPMVNFSLPKSQADQLERVLGGLPVNQVGALYFAIQNAITASMNAQMQSQLNAYRAKVLEDAEKAKEQPAPSAPKTE